MSFHAAMLDDRANNASHATPGFPGVLPAVLAGRPEAGDTPKKKAGKKGRKGRNPENLDRMAIGRGRLLRPTTGRNGQKPGATSRKPLSEIAGIHLDRTRD
jgi:hypothetical protein